MQITLMQGILLAIMTIIVGLDFFLYIKILVSEQ